MAMRPAGTHGQEDDRPLPVAAEDWVGVVIGAVLTAAGNAGADEASLESLRARLGARSDALETSSAELGIDSLTWLEVMTVLEERYDTLLPDEVVASRASHTVLGLADALADCLRRPG
ncbi:acyl carrier protein [Kitasatospora sp. NPDC057542]|uniref:acyl carrier protein n=1 Tax=Streptomycetaceae TaxID=2062 RepID=UPI001CCD7F15|nr:phosphopantetheine-binding protein [Streptomyces sp. LS1784]